MTCPNCNKQNLDTQNFCAFCGSALTPPPAQQPQTQQQPTQTVHQTNVYQTQPPSPQPQPNYQDPNFQQQTYQQQSYQQPVYPQAPVGAPVKVLTTDYSLLTVLLLSMVAFGIYGIYKYYHLTEEVNTVCSPHDGKKSMNYILLALIVSPLTGGIGMIVWLYNISNRIETECKRRNLSVDLSSNDFWLWYVLGSLIIVGPFIFLNKLFKAVNAMNESYNTYG